jgi:hypothetical protein
MYRIEGTSSDGDSFDFPGVSFDSFEAAEEYARAYARSVSGTDYVSSPEAGVIRAVGGSYVETLRIVGSFTPSRNFTSPDGDPFDIPRGE